MITWTLIFLLAVVGYAQRSVPWLAANRAGLPQKLQQWFEFVAPAAFATLAVNDLGHLDWAVGIAMTVATFVAWRTKNLGLTVLIAMTISLLSRLLSL
ncbi:MAG: AzlD domain-containing protein [Sulfobacillus sp.]